jgi:hypothetical protein
MLKCFRIVIAPTCCDRKASSTLEGVTAAGALRAE